RTKARAASNGLQFTRPPCPEPCRYSLGKVAEIHLHADGNVTINLDDLAFRHPSGIHHPKLFRNALVLRGKSSNGLRHLPKRGGFRECFKVSALWHDEWNHDVPVFFAGVFPQRPSSGLHNVDLALLRIGKHDAIDSWHIDTLC